MGFQVHTKFKIMKPAQEVFNAFIEPEQMANFWFSSGSEKMEEGKTITWRYEEYNAEVELKVVEIQQDKKIVFKWGPAEGEHTVTITLNEVDNTTTIIEVNETGWNENDPELIHQVVNNKEGWVYMLSCLKAYLENDISSLRASIVF